MLDIAAKRNVGQHNVQFVHTAAESFRSDERFDIIITSFLFDNFKQDKAEMVFENLINLLKSNGSWLFTDFHLEDKPRKLWQRWLLKFMYLFFGSLSEVEAGELPDTEKLFSKAAFKTVFQKTFYNGFIQSLVYQKS